MQDGDDRLEIVNRILLALPAASRKRLEQDLELIELVPGDSLSRIGAPVKNVYFINRGFVSIVKSMRDGRSVEIGANGNTDMVGLFALHGIERAAWESIVQVPGTAMQLSNDALRAEVERDDGARRLMERYTYQVLSGFAQTAACHRLHSLTQRFCRWILSAQDSAATDTLPLTHEALALMLGVQRSGVSIIASSFQKAGAIRCHRGRITVLDRAQLEAAACECYGTIRHQFDQILGPAAHGAAR